MESGYQTLVLKALALGGLLEWLHLVYEAYLQISREEVRRLKDTLKAPLKGLEAPTGLVLPVRLLLHHLREVV